MECSTIGCASESTDVCAAQRRHARLRNARGIRARERAARQYRTDSCHVASRVCATAVMSPATCATAVMSNATCADGQRLDAVPRTAWHFDAEGLDTVLVLGTDLVLHMVAYVRDAPRTHAYNRAHTRTPAPTEALYPRPPSFCASCTCALKRHCACMPAGMTAWGACERLSACVPVLSCAYGCA